MKLEGDSKKLKFQVILNKHFLSGDGRVKSIFSHVRFYRGPEFHKNNKI